MTGFVFPPAPTPYVPVLGGGNFPVRRIFCIGRNYAAHIREMGEDPDRVEPAMFCKPADAICHSAEIPYPLMTRDLHYEGELVIALQTGGRNIAAKTANSRIFGYAAGCDLTRRDLQAAAKTAKAPWDTAKALDNGAVIGMITPIEQCQSLKEAVLELTIDGACRQKASLAQMIWPVEDIIALLSRYFELRGGDLIYTGTPEGVGRVDPGEHVSIAIDGLCPHHFTLT